MIEPNLYFAPVEFDDIFPDTIENTYLLLEALHKVAVQINCPDGKLVKQRIWPIYEVDSDARPS